jgi:TRAP transporter 4TM/12TM fusion protein
MDELSGDGIKDRELEATIKIESRYRSMSGFLGIVEKTLLAIIPIVGLIFILRIPGKLGSNLWVEQYLGFFLGVVICAVFVKVPATKNSPRDRLPWYDAILALAGCVVGGYIMVLFPFFQNEGGGLLYPSAQILGTICIFLLLEACRRVFGWALVILTIMVLFHALFGESFPYPLTAKSFSVARLTQLIYVDQNGIMGVTLNVAGILVLAFVIFGGFLGATGGGTFLVNLALSVFGRLKGGAAKASLAASALLGTLTGIAVACIYTTGVITIPLMKKNKIDSATAGAIEATIATGAIIIPPVMGVVAFVMALFLAKSYAKVAIAAIVPAVLFVLGVYVQVDRHCVRKKIGTLKSKMFIPFNKVIKEDWIFFIPIGVLIVSLLVLQDDAEFSATYATFALFILSFFRKSSRFTLKSFVDTLISIGESVMDIAVVCSLAGIVIGCIIFTGIGLSLTEIFTTLSGGYLFPLMAMSAIVCIILGMGMPIVTVYILVAILVAPVLVKLGVTPMAAHMFCLYYSLLSFVTPPVCLSVYAASAVADAPPMTVAVKAMRFSIAGFLVPFAFVYDPSLMIGQGELGILHSVCAIFAAILGVGFLGLGLEGYFVNDIKLYRRILLIAAGIICLFAGIKIRIIVALIGLILLIAEIIIHKTKKSRVLAASQ